MAASWPTTTRRLPVVPPALPFCVAATVCMPLLVASLAEVTAPSRADSLRLTAAVAAFAGYSGLILTVGTLAFALTLWPGALDRSAIRIAGVAGAVLGLAGAVMSLLTSVSWSTGAAVLTLSPGMLADSMADRVVQVRLSALLMWTLVLPGLYALRADRVRTLQSPAWRTAAALVAFGLIRLTSVTAEQPLSAATTLASLAHLLAMTLWLGGLVTLCLSLRAMSAVDLDHVLPRFSRLAFGAVGVVVGTGATLTIAYLDAPQDLLATGYGRLILSKIALMGLVLVAARRSQLWVSRRLATGGAHDQQGAVRTLLCAVAVEVTLAIAVLVVASALVTAPGG